MSGPKRVPIVGGGSSAMVTWVGGDVPIVDAADRFDDANFLSQEQCDELLNGVTRGEPKTGTKGIEHALECLSHFKCGVLACRRWWSIGDWCRGDAPRLYCPWCGTKQEVAA